jgi:uncharacterized lipoprotein YddW (UPF0748 family)
MKKILGFFLLILLCGVTLPSALRAVSWGLWVECEGDNDTLSSKQKILRMLDDARENHFDTVFVQIYRHDRAWFPTGNADDGPYQAFYKREKTDLLRFVIDEAHARGIAVHGWMNMLRIGKDKNARVLKVLGPEAVTRDNKGRSMLNYPDLKLPGVENQYYEADGTGYWLEPGDLRVRQYLLAVIKDVAVNYPDIDGIHLDFVRMPYTVPFSPGSRFPKGITYGYGKESVERFKKFHGADPLKPSQSSDLMQKWDDWRRDQITDFVRSARDAVRATGAKMKLSTAVVCWADRAYFSSSQDWRRWLEDGIIDFACLMNYSIDSRIARYITMTGQAFRAGGQIVIGLGAYLLRDRAKILYQQIDDCLAIGVDGIAFFSYDSMLKNKDMMAGVRGRVERASDKPAGE